MMDSTDRLRDTSTVATPLVRLENVSKTYRTDDTAQTVLQNVTLDVGSGELTVLLGPSGSGKTTLLNLIGALDQPDSGAVVVCGTELDDARPRELAEFRARSVGFVFQFYNLLPTLTALENVVAGTTIAGISRHEARQKATTFLDRVGLANRQDRFPNQLSGGEQQRVAIARALAKGPRLVLADEPTGNLDTESGNEVIKLMDHLNEELGVTFIIVTHDPSLAEAARRVVRLSDGHLLAGVG